MLVKNRYVMDQAISVVKRTMQDDGAHQFSLPSTLARRKTLNSSGADFMRSARMALTTMLKENSERKDKLLHDIRVGKETLRIHRALKYYRAKI